MAIVLILAVAMAPVFVKRVDRDVGSKEVGELNVISNALITQVLRSNSIPNQTTWSALITNWAARPASMLATNSRGNARLFFYDQNGWMTNAGTWNNSGTLSPPANAGVALITSISRPIPAVGGALSSANFSSVWNATPGKVPSYLTSLGWSGTADDLVIQRVSLDQMFHHLVLTTRDNSSQAGYSINSGTKITVPNTAAGADAYYLHGATIGLWDANGLTNRFLFTGDVSFTFDGGMWQSQLSGGGKFNGGLATNFAATAAAFIATPLNGKAGSTAQSVLSSFYGFMYGFTVWANECPHFQASSTVQQADYQYLSVLGQQSSGIIDSTAGQNGLLK